MNFELETPIYYRVKEGQTIYEIALAFRLPPRLLAAENDLTEEVRAGQLLKIPQAEGNLYTVTGRENKTMLCGSQENFRLKNKTDCFYPLQTIFI